MSELRHRGPLWTGSQGRVEHLQLYGDWPCLKHTLCAEAAGLLRKNTQRRGRV